eukprot:11406467-Alexandrium_andersonii.AAC.1
MSASLVGSEMCIRDRSWADAIDACDGTQYASSWSEPVPTGVAPHEHQGPVSYTHLTLPTICSV